MKEHSPELSLLGSGDFFECGEELNHKTHEMMRQGKSDCTADER